jgi:hypothetical protein
MIIARFLHFFMSTAQPSSPLGCRLLSGAMALSLLAMLLPLGAQAQVQLGDIFYTAQHTPFDYRRAALGWSGCALTGGVEAAFQNPALPNAFARINNTRGLMAMSGYGRDDFFSGHIVMGGAAVVKPEKYTAGGLGRYLNGGEGNTDYAAELFYSARLFETSLSQGAVDAGLGLRFEKSSWEVGGFPTLYSIAHPIFDGENTSLYGSHVLDSQTISSGRLRNQRLVLDVGFYQAKISDNVDFGLVLHNALGYQWSEQSPAPRTHTYLSDTVDVPQQWQVVQVDQNRYEPGTSTTGEEWMSSGLRRLTMGVVVHSTLMDEALQVQIPVDLELLGLFEKGADKHALFRCGIEGLFRERIYGRFGFSRAPEQTVRGQSLPDNVNEFSGGFGLQLNVLRIDCFIAPESWGVGCALAY